MYLGVVKIIVKTKLYVTLKTYEVWLSRTLSVQFYTLTIGHQGEFVHTAYRWAFASRVPTQLCYVDVMTSNDFYKWIFFLTCRGRRISYDVEQNYRRNLQFVL
jgi:hypothetical protein